ncbi:MAG: hypothetical protein EA376_10340 [Phycisphaeraceae bacterium]|nr:MAG: hypothetical protein EA376_10340 [Phycisphaeraceae bacterium]
MTTTGVELLRLLGSGVRPDGASPMKAGAPIEGVDFGSLLKNAEGGGLESGRRVEVPQHLGLNLTDGQISRLSKAADAAEASGAMRMLAMIDGETVVVDIVTRTVEQSLGSGDAGVVLTGIDAAVMIPDEPAGPWILADGTNEDEEQIEPDLSGEIGPLLRQALAKGGLPGVAGGSGAFANRSLVELLASRV